MLWNVDPFEPLVSQFARPPAFLPPADLTVSDGDIVLTLDVPGMTDDDLSIELVDGHLVVSGERRRPDAGGNATLSHRERAFGRFERRVRMPDGVDPDAITASLKDGVLSLIVPKPERMRPRTIAIGASAGDGSPQLETATA
jgi:HSP20 family protein